ncbi:hypothetical protein HDE68_004088 [Pedobacter cryoconitis]|uniref:Uncharacterized protein n=1 Tax=Pedobacter cryoconitis TaxID=188932 RepID=A0A7W8ZQR6_9SPHI|nr:hypothetical protein [Pedobacter cryoconitis]
MPSQELYANKQFKRKINIAYLKLIIIICKYYNHKYQSQKLLS